MIAAKFGEDREEAATHIPASKGPDSGATLVPFRAIPGADCLQHQENAHKTKYSWGDLCLAINVPKGFSLSPGNHFSGEEYQDAVRDNNDRPS